jgi:8-oxo-dGTP diphosphatase
VCGLCWRDGKLLMVNHNIGNTPFWAPPGGGLEYGQTVAQTLVREFQEETNLTVTPGKFAFGCEFIQPPLHALELFYEVEGHGSLQTGSDPELPRVITAAEFLTLEAILALPERQRHGIFRFCKKKGDFQHLNGFYTI